MKTIGYTLRLPDELRRQVKVAAAQADTSLNAWIVEAIREKLGEKTMSNTNVLESPCLGQECIYCGKTVPVINQDPNTSKLCEIIPDVDDDEAWAELAQYHADDCEWIQTRAHQVE